MSTATDLIDDLQWRGLLADCTDLPGLRARLATGKPITVYCGFDPTGDSLHVGHLMGQLTLRRFQAAGHHVLALAGGATGMVGDPSGRSSERNLLTREQLAHNIACIKAQLARLLDFEVVANPARLVDNADWTAPISYLDFLRDIGKYFSLNVMLAKDSVRSRMEETPASATPSSVTSFCRPLIFCISARPAIANYKSVVPTSGATSRRGPILSGKNSVRTRRPSAGPFR